MKETPGLDSKFLFGQLSERLKKAPADVSQRILAHVREATGHQTLPAFMNNGLTEAQKVEVLRACLTAILKSDFSGLKGEVSKGQAVVAPGVPQEKPEPKPERNGGPKASGPPAKAPATAPTPVTLSWKVGCKTRGDATWAYNGLRFATEEEAKAYGSDLHGRWMALEAYEAHPSEDPVKNQWKGGKLVFLESEKAPEPPPEAETTPARQPDQPLIQAAQEAGKLEIIAVTAESPAGVQSESNQTPPDLTKPGPARDAAIDARMEKLAEEDAEAEKLQALANALRGLVQPGIQPVPAPVFDKREIEALIEQAVERRLRGFYADMQLEVKKASIEAKYQCLAVMQRAYDKNRRQLAAAIENIES